MTKTRADRFTRSDYEAILVAATKGGYAFARFTDPVPSPGRRRVYLRHDVDNTLESALRMAEVESGVDALATYFVMVRSENYNPFTGANVARMRRILELGHEIGLHFTAEEHAGGDSDDLASCIQSDAKLLEQATGEPVAVFSFHNPSDKADVQIEVPGLVNAYAPRYYDEACYLSESNMQWRHGSPVEVLAKGEHAVVQILVHPLSYRADFRDDRDVLLWFLREKVSTLLELNVGQNRVLREQGLTASDVADFLAEERHDT